MSLPKPPNDPADAAGGAMRSRPQNLIVKNWCMAYGGMYRYSAS